MCQVQSDLDRRQEVVRSVLRFSRYRGNMPLGRAAYLVFATRSASNKEYARDLLEIQELWRKLCEECPTSWTEAFSAWARDALAMELDHAGRN